MITAHAPTDLIADYAAGTLSCGMSLVVASHLTFCPCCRAKAERIETLGGALLSEGEAVAPTSRCLAEALARIEAPASADSPPRLRDAPLPRPICKRIPSPLSDLRWRRIAPGVTHYRMTGFTRGYVGLLQADPGVRIPAHGHSGAEAMLVLAGRLRDGGRTLARGDLALADERVEHSPEVVGDETCLCLLALAGGARFTGALDAALEGEG